MSKEWINKIIIMIGISVGSFIGFYVSFMLAAWITLVLAQFIGPLGYSIGRLIYLVLIYIVFFVVKTLKIPTWIKAIVFSMPMVSSLILIGIYGYGLSTPIIIGLSTAFVSFWAFYLWKSKWDWTYLYALTFVSVCVAYVYIAGIDI
jgi:hypothetical protein